MTMLFSSLCLSIERYFNVFMKKLFNLISHYGPEHEAMALEHAVWDQHSWNGMKMYLPIGYYEVMNIGLYLVKPKNSEKYLLKNCIRKHHQISMLNIKYFLFI